MTPGEYFAAFASQNTARTINQTASAGKTRMLRVAKCRYGQSSIFSDFTRSDWDSVRQTSGSLPWNL